MGAEWARPVTVGLRPREFFFAANGTDLYIITDSGISVIKLDKLKEKSGYLADTYDFGNGVDVSKLRVRLSAYGSHAVGFKPNDSKLYYLGMPTRLGVTTPNVSSLDIATILSWRPDAGVSEDEDASAVKDAGSPFPALFPGEIPAIGDVSIAAPGDGKTTGTTCALVVLPNQRAVLRVPIPGGFEGNIGSITTAYRDESNDTLAISPAPNSSSPLTALLFDKADLAPRATLLKLTNTSSTLLKSLRLAGSPDSVDFAADGSIALLTHNLKSSRAGAQVVGYSALSLDDPPFARFQATTEAPGPYVYAPDAQALFIIVRDDPNSVRELHRVAYDGLLTSIIKLDEKPRALGVLAGVQKMFVDLEHSDGHIVLYDWEGQPAGSVTGYLLPDRVKE
jgi:hypothetical protein